MPWRPNRGGASAFMRDLTHRYCALAGGVGCSKTWTGARKTLRLAAINRCDGIVGAETYSQLRQIMVPELLRAADEAHLRPVWRVADQELVLARYGWTIFCRSADKGERFAGLNVGYGWGDEVARWMRHADNPTRDAGVQIKTRLRDATARCPQLNFTTTPEGKDEFWHEFVEVPTSDHAIYTASTHDNRAHLDADFIPSLLRCYSREVAARYLRGEFIDLTGRHAYSAFSDANIGTTTYSPHLPVYVWWDFNVDPLCVGWGQPQGDPPDAPLHVLGEIERGGGAQSHEVAGAVCALLAHHRGRVVLFGDASGGSRTTTSELTNWRIVIERFRQNFTDLVVAVPAANPAVRDRVNWLNALCEDGTGRRRLVVPPSCVVHIADMRLVKWGKTGDLDKSDGRRTHASDALGYCAAVAYVVGQPSGNGVVVPPPPSVEAKRELARKLDPIGRSGVKGVSPW